jgi:hypothetical protein
MSKTIGALLVIGGALIVGYLLISKKDGASTGIETAQNNEGSLKQAIISEAAKETAQNVSTDQIFGSGLSGGLLGKTLISNSAQGLSGGAGSYVIGAELMNKSEGGAVIMTGDTSKKVEVLSQGGIAEYFHSGGFLPGGQGVPAGVQVSYTDTGRVNVQIGNKQITTSVENAAALVAANTPAKITTPVYTSSGVGSAQGGSSSPRAAASGPTHSYRK